jgi:hypothetical protein
MNAKLTLKLDSRVIEKAKDYAERRGTSLSQIVEGFFVGLAATEEPRKAKLPGVVGELAGVLAGIEIEDPKREYAEYLEKKYS